MSDAQQAYLHSLAVTQFLATLVPEPAKPVVATEPLAPKGLQKPAGFYDYIRGDVGELFPSMSGDQYHGCERLLAACAGKLPLPWAAYLLSTVYHETGRRMQPVREGFDVSDNWRKKNLRYFPWYGRGDVQLTWEFNYVKATARLRELGYEGVDLVANPDQALSPVISAAIVVHGMLEGWFTEKSLRDYIPAKPSRQHYVNARRIINGTDKADLIAGYALEFEQGLRLGEWL